MGGIGDYEVAQHFIRQGVWGVDLDAGLVLGMKRQPFTRTNSWGYIQIKFRRPEDWRVERAVLAHRVIWEAVNGPLPDGQQINHRNGTKTDNRPANLEAVTGSGNMLHAYQTGLTRPSRSNAKITPELALMIYRRCQAGERDTPLALEYGVNRSVVNNIRNGWTWAHVTGHKASGPRTAQEKRDANEARHAAMGGQGIDGR